MFENSRNDSQIQQLIALLKSDARISAHRRLLVFSGDLVWCHEQVISVLHALFREPVLLIGEQFKALSNHEIECISAKQYQSWLGRESRNIIFNAHDGFDVDAFGALSGTLCAGGLMVLLTPALEIWHQFNDPEHRRIKVYPQQNQDVSGYYLKRLSQIINSSDQVSIWTQSGQKRIQKANHHRTGQTCLNRCVDEQTKDVSFPYKSRSQMRAVQAIHKVLRGHRRRPLVLTAHRGRGKSAALGIAAAQLLLEGSERIIITAPSKKATVIFFQHAAEILGVMHESLLNRLEFIAPDDLVKTVPRTPLLFVDEAAAIPALLLEQMLYHYSRIVYATTLHGYEGSGRGFAIRFRHTLDSKTPQWNELSMDEPIRWASNDPMERFVFKALLLNAVPETIDESHQINHATCIFKQITSSELLSNEDLLSRIFGLLVSAHYQTRPLDLRHLLDGGNVELSCLFDSQGRLLAVFLAAYEGNIEPTLKDDIWLGKRRVRGHLLPQSLSYHVGLSEAICLQGLRIIRIAVQPNCQRSGLGRIMLHKLQLHAEHSNIDYLGTVFGATEDLLRFWVDSSYTFVRVGLSKDAASGTHSVMMLKPLSVSAQNMMHMARKRCFVQLQWLLMSQLQELDVEVVATILSIMWTTIRCDEDFVSSYDDQRELYSFFEGNRRYEHCLNSIKKTAYRVLAAGVVDAVNRKLIVRKVIQNHSWNRVVVECKLSGEKQARQRLKSVLSAGMEQLSSGKGDN